MKKYLASISKRTQLILELSKNKNLNEKIPTKSPGAILKEYEQVRKRKIMNRTEFNKTWKSFVTPRTIPKTDVSPIYSPAGLCGQEDAQQEKRRKYDWSVNNLLIQLIIKLIYLFIRLHPASEATQQKLDWSVNDLLSLILKKNHFEISIINTRLTHYLY